MNFWEKVKTSQVKALDLNRKKNKNEKKKRHVLTFPKTKLHAKNQKILSRGFPGKQGERQTERQTERDGPEFKGPPDAIAKPSDQKGLQTTFGRHQKCENLLWLSFVGTFLKGNYLEIPKILSKLISVYIEQKLWSKICTFC